MFKHFLRFWMFAFTMFAAAAPPMGGGGSDGSAAESGAVGDSASIGDIGDDLGHGTSDDEADHGTGAEEGIESGSDDATGEQQDSEIKVSEHDKETSDFKGLVSKRLVALKKEAPELAQVFQKYPKVQEQVEAAFRRDMAYRELYPTLSEARQMREQFPNGMADVEQLMTDVGEVEQLDKDFYSRNAQGQYEGHSKIINNMFSDDREAAVSLFRTLPKEWSRLDPDSYNEVMGQIVGATLQRADIAGYLTELRDAAKEAKQDGIAGGLDKLVRWASGFMKRKTEPTEDERRLEGQREQFRRETQTRQQEDFGRFRSNFVAESTKLQNSIIRKHPAVSEMLQTKALPEAKKTEIVEKIRKSIEGHLRNSRAFMAKLKPAYNSANLKDSLDLQKVAWSYPWVLNKFVRQVMTAETPNLVRRPAGARPPAASTQRTAANRGGTQQTQTKTRTEPYKENGMWYSKEGRRLTTSEILRGAVPDHLLHAK